MKSRILIFLLFVQIANLFAQIDTEFWFVAPEVTKDHGDAPALIRMTALDTDAMVTISVPSTGEVLHNRIFIAKGEQYIYTMPLVLGEPRFENKPANMVNRCGLKITSTAEISACYEIANSINPEVFTLKGRHALGTDFVIPSQNEYYNHRFFVAATEKIDIVATQNNTRVTITPSVDVVGHAAGEEYFITLQVGETYSVVNYNETAASSMQGTLISSDKPIAVTISDDSIQQTYHNAYDLIGDQLVPVDMLGMDYVAVNTSLQPGNIKKVYVTATQDHTILSIDGIVSSYQLDRGQQCVVDISLANVYIQASKPVYAYQLVSLSNASGKVNNEMGSALLPSLNNCSGSRSVVFQHTSEGRFYIQLIVKGKHKNNFRLTANHVDKTFLLTNSIWTMVQGTDAAGVDEAWYTSNISLINIAPSIPCVIENSSGLFHMGKLDENNSSVSYGYFSSFATDVSLDVATFSDRVELIADGCSLINNVSWHKEYIDAFPLKTDNFLPSIFYAFQSGAYYLVAQAHGGCELTKEVNVSLSLPTSILEDEKNEEVKRVNVYPNPNSGDFTIDLSAYSQSSELFLYNGIGQLVYHSLGSASVNINNITSGIYLLVVKDGNDTVSTKVVVK